MKHEDPQVLRIRNAWLRPDVKADTNPAIETRGDDVYISFPHLNLILVLDQQFYTHTLKSLLQTLAAVLTVQNGHVFVRYIRSRIEYPLERLVTARTEDYWSVKLRREIAQTQGKVTADYKASNIIVEKSAGDRAHGQWLTEEAQRNHDKPNRMFQVGGKRINQIHDANFISDGESRGERLPDKPTRPSGAKPDDKEDWLKNLRTRGNANPSGNEQSLLSSRCYPDDK